MTPTGMKIGFAKSATVPLADSEKLSLWDDQGTGSLTSEDGHLCIAGTWKVSMIGNLLGSGILGYILIRPLFQKDRAEKILAANIERVLVSTPKRGKKVYHVFQAREGAVSEVHVFASGAGTDESALDKVIVDLIGADRLKEA
jgi:hypothetical protein